MNRRWYGPRRGAQVTVVCLVGRIRICRAVIIEPYCARVIEDDGEGLTIRINLDPYGEGTTWCYEWIGEDAAALEAQMMLSRSA